MISIKLSASVNIGVTGVSFAERKRARIAIREVQRLADTARDCGDLVAELLESL